MLWLLGCLLVGAAIWSLGLFGAASDRRSGALMNGLVLAAAPWVAAFQAYAPVRSVPLAPRGLATTPELGGTWLWVMWAVMSLAPAAEFAWGTRRLWEALAVWAVVSATWLLVLEGQRRTRAALADATELSLRTSGLRINVEAIGVGVVWAAAFSIAGVLAPDEVPAPAAYAAASLAFGIAVAYASAIVVMATSGWLPAYASACFAVSILGVVQLRHTLAVTAYLVAGTVACVLVLEPKRRALLTKPAK